MSSSLPVALVTGVSSGIGHATARALVERGYRVFGTVRSRETPLPPEVQPVVLDVRDAESIEGGVRGVLNATGRIDLLVNNAGASLIGALEETSLAQAQALFDVNFFGAVRVTQAVLPAMRARKAGRIVFISSVLGFLPAPFMAFYSASKHALEGLAESLDHETRTFGVRAVLVEPGFTRTQIDSKGATASARIDEYSATRARAVETVRSGVEHGDAPEIVAAAVLAAATARRPKLRYPVGRKAGLLATLRSYMPASAFDGAFRKELRLDA